MPLMTISINDTLRITVYNADDPRVLIERKDAGLVRIEPHEIRHLVDALVRAGGELAASRRSDETPLLHR